MKTRKRALNRSKMFNYDLSDGLEREMGNLLKKDRKTLIMLGKKINEVASRDSSTIDFYKNLNAPLNEYKRVHVSHFVLLFKVYKERNFIFFKSFCHHDEAYWRK